MACEGKGLVCGDTGYPLFYVKAGNKTQIAGGFGQLWEAARQATVQATTDSFLRPTMVDPISRDNPGNNIGNEIPKVELEFDGEDGGLEIIAIPKGGGSEIFGTFYKMLYPSDGKEGVFKFVVDSVYKGCYAGKICPPAIVGVGIGGTADICMRLAKKAAVLTPIGQRNSDPQLLEMERKLLAAFQCLGIGPMGSRGINAVIGLSIAKAATHTAALPVAVNAQCSIGRRWKAKITSRGEISYTGDLNA